MAMLIIAAICAIVFAFGVLVGRISDCLSWREVAVLGTVGGVLVAGALFAGSFL